MVACNFHIDDAVRGRVMALWIMGFGGTVPLGLLAAGAIAGASSVRAVVLGGAAVALLITLGAWLRDPTKKESDSSQ